METIKQFCKDKKIIIVGNGKELLYKKRGHIIDSYDVVVRMNSGYPRKELIKYTGSKTDIWFFAYTSLFKQLREYIEYKKPSIVIRNNPSMQESVVPELRNKCFYLNNDHRKYIKDFLLDGKQGKNPTTGFMTIMFFLEFIKTQKCLDIIGFDFFKHKQDFFDKEENPGKAKSHNPSIEKIKVEKMININTIGRI